MDTWNVKSSPARINGIHICLGEVVERIEELFQPEDWWLINCGSSEALLGPKTQALNLRMRAGRCMDLLGGHPREPRWPWFCILEDKTGPAGEWSMALSWLLGMGLWRKAVVLRVEALLGETRKLWGLWQPLNMLFSSAQGTLSCC